MVRRTLRTPKAGSELAMKLQVSEGAHLLPTDPGNQATIGPYSEPLCNLENGAPARQKKKKEKNSVRNVPLGVGNTRLSRQKAPVC